MARRSNDDRKTDPQGKPLAVETKFFFVGVPFFTVVWIAYMYFADFEPVGTVGLALLAAMWLMLSGFLWLVGRRTSPRPEDNQLGEIEERAGYHATFAPSSWWPLVLGVAAALAFLGTALGWWITGLGGAVALIGLVGAAFEFNRGQHAH